jgi:hypothetical protein
MIADRLGTSESSKETVRALQRKLYLKAKQQSGFPYLEKCACLRKKSIGKPYAPNADQSTACPV